MMDRIIETSPLGSLSHDYLTKNRHGILLRPKDYILELYLRGEKDISPIDKEYRRKLIRYLWEITVTMNKEEQLYPLNTIPHNLKLICDSKNLNVYVTLNMLPTNKIKIPNEVDLGYIPSVISNVIKNNISTITGGKILKIKTDWHNKNYIIKVVLYYGKTSGTLYKKMNVLRLTNIINGMR
jgi:hypothetical protein